MVDEKSNNRSNLPPEFVQTNQTASYCWGRYFTNVYWLFMLANNFSKPERTGLTAKLDVTPTQNPRMVRPA